MHLVDANVLLYAVNTDAERHAASRAWLDRALSGTSTVGFAWVVMLAFVRLSTKIGLFPNPLTVDAAMSRVEEWTAASTAVVVDPTARHVDLVRGLLRPIGTGGNLVNDAHLAALSIEHRGAVVSWDNDFARFSGVRWLTPASALLDRAEDGLDVEDRSAVDRLESANEDASSVDRDDGDAV